MASAWKQKRGRRWTLAFRGLDRGGRATRCQISAPERIASKADALALAEHLEQAAAMLDGRRSPFPALHGLRATEVAVAALVGAGVIPEAVGQAIASDTDPVAVTQVAAIEADLPRTADVVGRFRRRPGIKRSTRLLQDQYLDRWVASAPSLFADAMSPEALRRYRRAEEDRGTNHPSAVTGGAHRLNLTRQVLSSLASWAVGQGLLIANPLDCWPVAKYHPREKRLLAEEEIARLIAAGGAHRDGAGRGLIRYGVVVRLLVETGIRRGELARLRWGDILPGDPARLIVAVRPGWSPKSGRSREIPLRVETARLLAEWRASLPPRWAEDGAPVTGYGATARAPRRCEVPVSAMQAIHRAAAVPWSGWHVYRHTFAVRLLRAGFDILELQRLLGHSTPTTSLGYLRWAQAIDWSPAVAARLPAAGAIPPAIQRGGTARQ